MESPVSRVAVGGIGVLNFVTQNRPDRFIGETLRRGDEWEPFESFVFRRCVAPGSFVCDVGADIGWYSVIAARLGATVFAFEVDPEAFAVLRTNLSLNSCEGVEARCAPGLTEKELDAVVDNQKIDVLKLSTSGAEAAILRGAADVLAGGVGALFIEFRPKGLRLAENVHHEIFEIDSDHRCLWRTSSEEIAERTRVGRFSAGGEHLNLVVLAPEFVARLVDLIRDRPLGRPLADVLVPAQRQRVELAVSCNDAEAIPKVADAGRVVSFRGTDVQIMHNGVKVVAGAYYGAWQAEIIERLHGHFEPQEELVFDQIVQRVSRESSAKAPPVMVELGAFWSYYALWFLNSCPDGRAVLVEPDPAHLEVLRANLALNDRSATVIQAAVGSVAPGTPFECEGGDPVLVDWLTLPQILDRASIDRADIVLSDIQGPEAEMLEAACGALAQRVRFLVVSTHHASISGRWDTHQRCLSIIRQSGGHVIAEHSVDESFSGDGLIAASFDARDRDMHIDVSRARVGTGLFADVDEVHQHVANLEHSLGIAVEYAQSLEEHRKLLEQRLLDQQPAKRRWRRDR